MQDDKQNYLSDEELQKLIRSVEQEGTIHAPQYMKESILNQIQRQESVTAISNHRSSKIQLITYSAKVLVAAAAAIVLTVLIPIKDPVSFADEKVSSEQWVNHQNGKDEEIKYNEYGKTGEGYKEESKSIYDTTNKICSKLLEKTNKLFDREDK
jgi:hypothetical protein